MSVPGSLVRLAAAPVYISGRSERFLYRRLQRRVDGLTRWRLKINEERCVAVRFTKKRSTHHCIRVYRGQKYAALVGLRSELLIYTSILWPIFLFGALTWVTDADCHLKEIGKLQSKLRRFVGGYWCVSKGHIHDDLGVPSLRNQIIRTTALTWRRAACRISQLCTGRSNLSSMDCLPS